MSVRVARIRTDDWPERERVEMFRQVFGGDKIRVEPRPNEPLRIDATLIRFTDLTILRGQRSALESEFADGNDRLILNLGGPAVAMQFGREQLLERGDAIALSGTDRGALTTLRTGRIATLAFPRGSLVSLLSDPRRSCGRRIPKRSPSLRLLRGYVRMALGADSGAVPSLPQLSIAHIHDLAALAIGAGREAAEIAHGRGVRAARLQAIKDGLLADIAHNVSVNTVAAQHGVSPRYVRMLFEGEGTSMTEFVREERLKRARRILLSPRAVGRRIAEIAYEVGFNDLSYFNRSFRRRFGHSPSEVQGRARDADDGRRRLHHPGDGAGDEALG